MRKVWFAKYAQRAPGSVAGRERDAHVGAERVGLRGEHAVVVARSVERDVGALVEQPAAASLRRARRGRGRRRGRARRSRGAARGGGGRRARGPLATDPAASEPTLTERGDGRRAADAVGVEPASRWNWRSAVSVSGPRMPSSRPASKPSALSRRWSSLTSSPRSIGAVQVEQPVAEREAALDQRAPGLGSADAVDAQRRVASGTRGPPLERLVAEDADPA